MDLQLLLRVVWRFRALVACGLAVGILLATLSYVRINPGGSPLFEYRQA